MPSLRALQLLDTLTFACPRRQLTPRLWTPGSAKDRVPGAASEGDGDDGTPRGGGEGGGRKRAAESELLDDKPDVKRRNRRLFGVLMGTLQRFK